MCSPTTCGMKISFQHLIFLRQAETKPVPYISVKCLGGNFYPNLDVLPGRLRAQHGKAMGFATDLVSLLEDQLWDSVDGSI